MADPRAVPPPLGQVIDDERFEVLERLGGGGGGEVYRVRDRERGVEVALKLLRKGDPTSLYRFKQEFRALSDVAHPNLVEYYELVARQNQWFLTMEYIDGVDFLTYVREGLDAPEPEEDEPREPSRVQAQPEPTSFEDEEDTAATRVGATVAARRALTFADQYERLQSGFRQLAAGVQALHEAGQLHRDIKPTNLLVRRDGRVVILDFGVVTELAHLGGESDGPDLEDQIVGTPAYMAPEQSAGGALSTGSDWYSVGVVVYEALTGGRPFGGSVRQSLGARMRFDPPAPSTFAPGVPREIDELCMALLDRDPSARPTGRQILSRLGVKEPTGGLAPRTRITDPTLLIGREPHIAALRHAFAEACRGRSHAVLVHGSTGMGKTAVVQLFLREISERGAAVVLEGRCYEHESMPYKALDPVVDALSRYLLSMTRAQLEAVLPADLGALARLFPVLRRVEVVVGGVNELADSVKPAELRRRAIEALRALVAALSARTPLIFYIDDLQWGDTDSAALIQEILRPPQSAGMLFLASYRSEDARTSPFLSALLPLPSVPIEIAVTALSPAEALIVAERLLGGVSDLLPTIARSIARESAGNPFFVHELVRYVRSDTFSEMSLGTITLEEVIRVRLTELPAGARRLLDVVAVAGHPVTGAAARRATEIGGEFESAVHLLRARNLIRTRSSGERILGAMEPYHDRIREVAVSLISERELRDLHHSLAIALSVEAEPDPEALADHFEGAGDLERAAQFCMKAAELASKALAFERATHLYRRALATRRFPAAEEVRVLAALAQALGDCGRGAEAAAVYKEAASKAEGAEGLLCRRLAGEHLLRVGHVDEGIEIIHAVADEVGLKVARTRFGALLSLVWRRARLALGGLRYRQQRESEIAPAELQRLDACWSAATGLAMVDTLQGLDFQTRHLSLALRAGEPQRLARALALEAGYVSTRGRAGQPRFERIVREARALARDLDHREITAWLHAVEGLGAYQRGEFVLARDLCEQAILVLAKHGTTVFFELTSIALYHLWSLHYVGDTAGMRERTPVLLREAEARGDLYSATNFSTGLCVMSWLARDEPEEIAAIGAAAIERWSHRDYHLQHYWYYIGISLIDLYQ
ncbi:MAG TPA: protein kinase, partial [Kofleriaceae bacterium]|nr:protein kinase [Kofleriaceae bacterium]